MVKSPPPGADGAHLRACYNGRTYRRTKKSAEVASGSIKDTTGFDILYRYFLEIPRNTKYVHLSLEYMYREASLFFGERAALVPWKRRKKWSYHASWTY